MKLIKWIFFNGLFMTTIYYGFFQEIEGAYRVAMFFAWANIVFSFFMLADPVVEKMKEKGRAVPKWINATFDLVVVVIFAWFGAWITGAFWLVHLVVQEAAWEKAAGTKDA